jgi:hypothetical protein
LADFRKLGNEPSDFIKYVECFTVRVSSGRTPRTTVCSSTFERAFEYRALDRVVLALRLRPELGAAMILYILLAFCSHLFKHTRVSVVFDP